MALGIELGEERALDDIPVAVEPSPDERRASRGPQPVDIAGIIVQQGWVVADLRGDEDADQARLGILDRAIRAVVDHPVLDPVMPRASGVAGGAELASSARGGP